MFLVFIFIPPFCYLQSWKAFFLAVLLAFVNLLPAPSAGLYVRVVSEKQEVLSSTLCSGCGYWIRLIFTNVFTLLQGASSSTPGVARRGSSHQELPGTKQ
jgi:hypothetical protein